MKRYIYEREILDRDVVALQLFTTNYDLVTEYGDYFQLEEGEQVIKWHKVEDGLPELDRNKSVYVKYIDNMISKLSIDEFTEWLDTDLTHWAEIPEVDSLKETKE